MHQQREPFPRLHGYITHEAGRLLRRPSIAVVLNIHADPGCDVGRLFFSVAYATPLCPLAVERGAEQKFSAVCKMQQDTDHRRAPSPEFTGMSVIDAWPPIALDTLNHAMRSYAVTIPYHIVHVSLSLCPLLSTKPTYPRSDLRSAQP